MKLKLCLLLVFLTAFSLKNFATHIVGGEIYYDYLGGNNYKVTLKIYRDCCPSCAPFDVPAPYIGVFNSVGTLLDTVNMGTPVITPLLNTIVNPCFTFPNNVCVEEGDYVQTINLPPIPGGYTLTYQRCCRNSAILNIANASNVGSTYSIQILPNNIVATNSSPRYSFSRPYLFVLACRLPSIIPQPTLMAMFWFIVYVMLTMVRVPSAHSRCHLRLLPIPM